MIIFPRDLVKLKGFNVKMFLVDLDVGWSNFWVPKTPETGMLKESVGLINWELVGIAEDTKVVRVLLCFISKQLLFVQE